MKNLKPILLALGVEVGLLANYYKWGSIGTEKLRIQEEIRSALKEEGFTDFCTRQRGDDVYVECFDFYNTEGRLSASANSEFEAWIELFGRYKNIKEDGE